MVSRRARTPLRFAAAVMFALAPAACSWIEWSDEPPAEPPAPPPQVAETPPPPPFMPAKPPAPRPAAPAPAADPVAKAPSFDASHTVKRGETLFSVARLYEVDTFTLASLNGLRPPYSLEAGQVLKVPRRGETLPSSIGVPPPRPPGEGPAPVSADVPAPSPKPATTPPPAPAAEDAARGSGTPALVGVPPAESAVPETGGFAWPVKGEVVSSFGARPDGRRSDGIDIAAKRGSPVRAARGGRVHYAGNQLKSYGNMVLIRHDNDWWTLYAHADELLVVEGQTVKKGDIIARVGVSGDLAQPLLHFEMRQGKKAVNPLSHLPRQRA